MHYNTQTALLRRDSITDRDLGILLGCTEEHARLVRLMEAKPSAREAAILRLCANVRDDRIVPILEEMRAGYEWRPIPGFTRYEASANGQIRRCAGGHGSLPGHVLRPRSSPSGHLYVNLADDAGNVVRRFAVHRGVCLAFHGEPPQDGMIICHKNDVPTDNRPDNLYWGTHSSNADDRVRNGVRKAVDAFTALDTRVRKNGTNLPRGVRKALENGEITPRQARYLYKKSMDYRKSQEKAA